jgi:hypothetical protein
MKLVVNIAFGVAVSAAILYAFWHWFGVFGLVYGMPVIGVLGWPLVEVMTGFPRLARHLALRKVAGRYFEFRGRAIDIHIDADARCWVSTADARKIVVSLPAEAVLQRLAPLQCRVAGEPMQWRITTEGLAAVLARSTDAEVVKFCHWLETGVARPARNRLERGMLTPR